MHAGILLLGSVVAVIASITGRFEERLPQAAISKEINVKITCLPGRGVSFDLQPWSVNVEPGDSLAWRLDARSNVDSMDVVEQRGRWPFQSKPPYRSTKAKPAGARELDPNQPAGKYKYAIHAVCVRSANPAVSDTVLIDPDMIIIRGGS